ncbi:putative major pilin subunit [Limihaloglobus sulfuriphilus]|uniref:Putative major pilin subunit n=1 Tax=Limihaloglobus sulfuriphilus TaxID=1851148 RepID=A0A1Q2MAG5_9BACT|nr:type II secretion system protein [Limihaloglobus sulfuriphilus]AQQ69713.1 putative major pilin subunit [Limihaloglobus sulfuriphilus]
MTKKGFTLIELLVVISIIALLMAILMPALTKVREQARTVVCASKLRQIHIGSVAYSNDNDYAFPDRGKLDALYPHSLWDGVEEHTNLNEIFVRAYLGDSRDDIMFCPGELRRWKDPADVSTSYNTLLCTYQYFNTPQKDYARYRWHGYGVEGYEMPNISKSTSGTDPRTALWGCLTYGSVGKRDLMYGHDQYPGPVEGMNVVSISGVTEWVEYENFEAYWYSGGLDFYWPNPERKETNGSQRGKQPRPPRPPRG